MNPKTKLRIKYIYPLLLFVLINIGFIEKFVQNNYFKFSDKTFTIGQIKREDLIFDFTSCGLRPESIPTLDSFYLFLIQNPKIKIEIGVHTDYRGKDETNIRLTQCRAGKVRDYLLSKRIESNRVTAIGYGESEPTIIDYEISKVYPKFSIGQILDMKYIDSLLSIEEKESAHLINRRTIFKIIETD